MEEYGTVDDVNQAGGNRMQQGKPSDGGAIAASHRALLVGLPLLVTLAFCGVYGTLKYESYHKPLGSVTSSMPAAASTPITVVAPLSQPSLGILGPMQSTSGIEVITSSGAPVVNLLNEGYRGSDPQTAAAAANVQNATDDTGQANVDHSRIGRQSNPFNTNQKLHFKSYLKELENSLF